MKAAQYLRVSTGDQVGSLAIQREAIARYARQKQYEIVTTYCDEGVSGLTLKNRTGICQLLFDVSGGRCGFGVVLVYDVSRWGRFQDTDESAHYEFLCRSAGVEIEYCAEPFENDGSLTSSLLKSLKRAMAAEYSRDLSRRVTTAKQRLSAQGDWYGNRPGLGYRRLMIDDQGRPSQVLANGEFKPIRNYRVSLIPGPDHEVALVKRIFRLFVDSELSRSAIARLLNAEGARTGRGGVWTNENLSTFLSDRKYLGEFTYNKSFASLGGKRHRRPEQEWLRTIGAWAPIVDEDVFEAAQSRLRGTARRRRPAAASRDCWTPGDVEQHAPVQLPTPDGQSVDRA